MTFDDALAFVLKWEGGYSDNPNDPGGATNLGVTHITLAEWLGRPVTKIDVENLTFDDVRPIYEQRYWLKCRCPELPPGLDLMTFDSAVNCGPTRAVQFLQRAVRAKTDGLFGPATLAAVQAADPKDVIMETATRRAVHYCRLNRDEFTLGWLRRLLDCYGTALAVA